MEPLTNGENLTDEAREDICFRVVPILGMRGGDEIISRVAAKHQLSIERVLRIARNIKKRQQKKPEGE